MAIECEVALLPAPLSITSLYPLSQIFRIPSFARFLFRNGGHNICRFFFSLHWPKKIVTVRGQPSIFFVFCLFQQLYYIMVKDEIYSVGKEEGTTGFSAKNTIFHYDFILTKLTVVQPDRHERATTVLIWKEDGGARCALELNNFTVSFLSSTMEAQGLEDNTTRFVLYSRSRIRKVIVCLGSTSSLPTGEDKQLAANIHPGQPLSIQFNGNEEAVFTVEEREVEEVRT